MNIMRKSATVEQEKWARYRYNLTTALGENGKPLTGCQEHIELSRKVATEGMVLLENNGLLPLKAGTRVAVFGIGSIDYIKGGWGSGQVYSGYIRNIYEGLAMKAPYVSVYEPLAKYYYDYMKEHLAEHEDKIFEEIDVPTELVSDAAKATDVALIVIHRFSGEGWDRTEKEGDFLLTATEHKMVLDVTEQFDKVAAILDVGGMIND